MADETDLFAIPLSYRADVLAGQVALVTGGGTGLGRAIAIAMARLGAKVFICGRRADPLAATVAEIRAHGLLAEAIPCSVRDREQIASLLDRIYTEDGRLDILVNNGGGQFVQSAIDLTPNGWQAVIDTNLNGTWNMMQMAAQRWRDHRQGGRIVNVVLDIWRGIPGMAHSVAARAGVVYLSKTVAVEWAPLDIRVNCLAPGVVETGALENYPDEVRAKVRRDANVQRRAGSTIEVVEGCLYLVLPSSGFVTGEVLTVDGGQQLWGDVWAVPKPGHFRFSS
ncbi:SDR family oxidoreductase [Bosea sp. (in: a-proteobacteria)]|uniref:SDR family oxidoreductase n=1 Tax=Bosea sp. (in: a-proteobacteria) TaxID=1871050 RepID=UPI00261E75AE|nr:SDR family oxidoreductase [Bosea sp. (in: a-proteobacteria)]MCO5090914.1 SDR family oxidoreductase [Bosea sp. (in: a-proteobacteria)]